jgi:U-box domain/Sel1 repeat
VLRKRQLEATIRSMASNDVHSNSRRDSSQKRQKKMSSVADYLICPITRELPCDPVTAEDGRIYERVALEAYINNNHHRQGNSNLRSPVTHEPMGDNLLPAPQYETLIMSIIATGVIEEGLVSKWTAAKEKMAAKDLVELANGGDTIAMENVGINFELGRNGFHKDCKKAYYWYKRGHTLGHVPATANLGACLCDGVGVIKKDTKLGLMYLSIAASKGSDYAAFVLGMSFSRGVYGTVKDRQEARHWLQKCLDTCDYHQMTNEMKTKARLELNGMIMDEIMRIPDAMIRETEARLTRNRMILNQMLTDGMMRKISARMRHNHGMICSE